MMVRGLREAMRRGNNAGGAKWLLLCTVILAGTFCVGASAQAATSPRPWWHMMERVAPTNAPPGGETTVTLNAVNVGDAPTSGELKLDAHVPAGFSVQSVEMYAYPVEIGKFEIARFGEEFFLWGCGHDTQDVRCHFILPLLPFEDLEARVRVKNEVSSEAAPAVTGEVSGGEASPAKIARAVGTGTAPPRFGVEQLSFVPEEEGGGVDVQAGSHPFQATSTLAFNESGDPSKPPALPRDLSIKLPPGFAGNTNIMPQCSAADFMTFGFGSFSANACPADTVVGVAVVTVYEPVHIGFGTFPVPLFNLVPEKGEPARFGFDVAQAPAILDTKIRSGEDYGVTVQVSDITQIASFLASNITIWGVPGEKAHNEARGWSCLVSGRWYEGFYKPSCEAPEQATPGPLLTLPTGCGSFDTSVEGRSWPVRSAPEGLTFSPVGYALTDGFGRELGIGGCGVLRFDPSISVTPDEHAAASPSGLDVHIHTPQGEFENAEGFAQSAIKDLTVTLPRGLTVNPAGADGLEACSEAAVGYRADQSDVKEGVLRFDSNLPEGWQEGSGFCPNASEIGTVDIATRLLPPGQDLKGAVYLASQNENPFGSLLAMYLVVQDPVSGVGVVMAGQVTLDEHTGQLVSTFKHFPQLPFEDAHVHFFGGARGPLSTPAACGAYVSAAAFTPWSADPENQAASTVNRSSAFDITKGPNGGPCTSPQPFNPSLVAGTTNTAAGAFAPFTMTMGREDGSQNLNAISMRMPPGLLGLLSSVKLCEEPQASEGACGPESLIGETTVSVGLGGEPFTVKGGKVYVTGPYAGAPYGLSIVNPAKAGPFDLAKNTGCDCIVVRAKIEVDPVTAQLTITSDPPGSLHAIPAMLQGVPLQIKYVNVTVNRPDFTFNPTNCSAMAITGALTSTEGASSNVSVPFAVHDCANLAFKPAFAVSTSGHSSRQNGASLHVKLAYPKAPFGSQANIKSVKVDLPRQLPSRLTTLQKACTDRVFSANPASCPAASRVGSAIATTPLVPVPLVGPAYFVSHGGAKFPELIVVLSGYGVTLDLHGETFINKAGITSSTFRTVPDAPVGTFELTLPQGPDSALAANGNLCTSSLKMPTTFVAQNGATIHQSTPISVSGCRPAIRVAGHSVNGSHASIRVVVPSAGTLVASGRYIKRSVGNVAKAGTATIGVALTSQGLSALAKNPHQRVNANVKLRFSQKHGAPLTTYVRLLLG